MSRPQFPSRRSRPIAAHLAGASVVLAMLVVGTVTVFAEVPTAGFIVTPDPPVAGQSATFIASANDPDGLEIVKYEWDFEGGGYVDGGATQPHTFATAGTKSVNLRVTDAAAEVTEVTQAVTVDDPPPPPPTPPSNLTPPTVSGTPVDGGTLTATNGVWNGTEPITYTRQWQRCQSVFCSDISGATGTSYSPVSGDVGQTIRVVVTADNEVPGSVSEPSAATGAVAAIPPENTSAPSIDGDPVEGEALSASNGTWSGTTPITFPAGTRQWQRCDAAGAACVPIATTTNYTLKAADVGSTIRVRITADNFAPGTATVLSAAFGPIQAPPPGPPVNTDLPTIAGLATEGGTLFVGSTGSWDGTRPFNAFQYQWQRCAPACVDVLGASTASYPLTPADVGATIRLRVTASNAVGFAAATTAPTAAVARRPPVNLGLPSISGPASVGGRLTAFDGVWTGTAPITYTRKWLRCNTAGGACVQTSAAGLSTYALTPADFGKTIRVEVTADNASVGSVKVMSAPTPPIVQNLAPIAGFRSSPAAPVEGDTVDFTSIAYDPDGPIARYAWDLDGDGDYADDNASDRVASKAFTKAGQHTVRLRVTDTDGATDVETAIVNVGARPVAPLKQLSRPFLRLKYSSSRTWTRIKIFSVRVPRGATVKTRCRGRGCPKSGSSSIRSKGRTIRVRRLERRRLRVGTKVALLVSYPGRIGRYTSLVVRSRARIARKDLCLMPGKRKPVRCPPE